MQAVTGKIVGIPPYKYQFITTLAWAATSAKEVNGAPSDELLLFFYLPVHQTLAVSAHRGLCNIYYVTAPRPNASLTYQCSDWTGPRVDKTGHYVDRTEWSGIGHRLDITGHFINVIRLR